MDPNQQPNAPQPDGQQFPPPQPQPLPQAQPQYQQPVQQQNPQTSFSEQPVAAPPPAPQTPTSYAAPEPSYDPNYLDSIAPAPPPAKFLSGSFGKIFFGLLILFFLAVSLIIAFSGKDSTADLQQISVRLDNFTKVVKAEQKDLKSNNLKNTNTNYQIWLSGNQAKAEDLLKSANVKKTQYSKTMVASEKKISDDLTAKYGDALLNAKLDRIYASSMAAESEKIINLLNTMSKKSKSKQIRDFAKGASNDLTPIQKSFDTYVDDGTN